MLLYVVRHGQTDWNAESRFQGQKDIPLNALGRSQAAGNGTSLLGLLGAGVSDFDYVSSPLSRTRETMELMRAAMGLEPGAYRTDVRLKEICFGDWEGLTVSEVDKRYPDRVAARALAKWDFIPPGDEAESYEILSWRIGAWLQQLEKPCICVCHGGVIRSIVRLVSGMDKDVACDLNIPQDNILVVDRQAGTLNWI